LDDFDLAFTNIKYGIDHLSKSAVEKGLIELGSGVFEVVAAFRACGLETLAEEIETIAGELSTGAG
jgi:hypothetical protein